MITSSYVPILAIQGHNWPWILDRMTCLVGLGVVVVSDSGRFSSEPQCFCSQRDSAASTSGLKNKGYDLKDYYKGWVFSYSLHILNIAMFNKLPVFEHWLQSFGQPSFTPSSLHEGLYLHQDCLSLQTVK